MASLTSSWQYLGRSSAMVSNNGKWNYYILLYGKTVPNAATGKHAVYIRQVIASTVETSFYSYSATSHSGRINGVTVFSGTGEPASAWETDSGGVFTAGGVTYDSRYVIGEGNTEVDCSDGESRDIVLSCSWAFTGTSTSDYMVASGVSRTVSVTVTLPAIARAASFDSFSSRTGFLDGGFSLTFTPKDGGTLHKRATVYVMLDGVYEQFSESRFGVASSTHTGTFTINDYWLGIIYSAHPDSTEVTLKATLGTYTDEDCTDEVGSETLFLEVQIPENEDTKPVVTVAGVSPVHSLPSAFDAVFIQGNSRVKADFTAEGRYGAEILSSYMTVEGETYDSADGYTSGYLSGYGSVKVTVTAKDSRGFLSSAEETVGVLAYSAPKILPADGETEIVCGRCDADGNLSESGTYLKLKAKRSYSKCMSDGTALNSCAIRYRYRADGETSYSDWVTVLDASVTDVHEVDTPPLSDGAFDAKTSYLVQVGVIDAVGHDNYVTVPIATEAVFCHRRKNSLGLGGYVGEENLLDCHWNARFRGELRLGEDGTPLPDYIYPVGSIYLSDGTGDPAELFGGEWEAVGDSGLSDGVISVWRRTQ